MEFGKSKGNELFIRTVYPSAGLGIGSWLNLEHFMLGIPTPEKQMKEAFTEVFADRLGQPGSFDISPAFLAGVRT